jgi:hypothetical protein
MKNTFKFFLFAAALLLPGWLQAKTFEGTVNMQISSGRNETHSLTYSIKESRLRTDIQTDNGMSVSAIMDLSKDEMIMLMPAQSMYMTMSLKATVAKATGQKGEDTELVNTGITEKILGYTCTKYLAKSKDGDVEIWATNELGTFMGLGNFMGGGKAKSGWESAVVGKDFFPLRVRGATGSRNQFALEAKSVAPKSLPDSLFSAPAGFQKFDMGGMMQGMGGANPFGK